MSPVTSGFPDYTPETIAYRVGQLERDMEVLSKKIDRLVWGLVTLTITIAGSAIVFALTVATMKGSK